MVLACYHYKYNDTVPAACSGPFEQCSKLVECSVEGAESTSICFTLARREEGSNSTVILSAGCYAVPSHIANECLRERECIGTERGANHYCCCTENGCNDHLIAPEIKPPMPSNSSSVEDLSPLPGVSSINTTQSNSILNNHLSVILIVVLALVSIITVGVCFKRSRKRRNSISQHIQRLSTRATNSGDQLTNHPNGGELNDMRVGQDVSVLMPLRNSFGDNNNFQFDKQQSHQANNHNDSNNLTNHASRISTNHNSSIESYTVDNGQQQQNQQEHQNNPQIDLKRIKLLELVGSGRFGTVHKAILDPEKGGATDDDSEPHQHGAYQLSNGVEIAVKIIPNSEQQSWQNELWVYSSPKTRHPNILNFIGSTENPDTRSHWLLVEYASNGSLHHYLKSHTVSWPESLSIALGIVRGLSHLHDADIAHRDFKSKNVLLRHNLSPCITDFGVASMLDLTSGSHTEQRKKYLQVGTPRYMAPEVLECSVAFTKISFTKIDVYALSLVLWELLSRCHPLPKPDYDAVTMLNFSYTGSQASECKQRMIPPYHHQQTTTMGSTLSPPPISSTPNAQRLTTDKQHKSEGNTEQLFRANGQPSGSDITSSSSDDVNTSLLARTNGVSTESRDETDFAVAPPESFADEPVPQREPVPPYLMPFEDVVGSNPDINTIRQAVVKDRIRPPIKPEWQFYPVSKLCQAIVDGWEYDHDARISASCFVERIEALQQEQRQQPVIECNLPTTITT